MSRRRDRPRSGGRRQPRDRRSDRAPTRCLPLRRRREPGLAHARRCAEWKVSCPCESPFASGLSGAPYAGAARASEGGQLALAWSDAPLGLLDGHVVDAGLTAPHVAQVVELPLLVAVGPPPLACRIVRLVLEADGDAVAPEGPQVLAQPVVELAFPL